MVDTTIYRWADGSLAVDEWCDTNPGTVFAADSFLVADGRVVELDRHFARFKAGVDHCGKTVDTERFARDVREVIPRSGSWFPRIEAVDYGDGALLRLLVRPAPEQRTTASVVTAPHDPRTQPLVKGPDLAVLGNLRRDSGADEAVIVSDGVIAEGAWSSIVWWDNDRLHRVADSVPRLASITESVIVDHARYIGAPVIDTVAQPAQLDGAEVWILSALHGIRLVTEWINGPSLHTEPGRIDYWRQQYVNRRIAI